MTKKKWKKPILVPEANHRMHEMRFEIAKQMNYVSEYTLDWWEILTPLQKSKVNGQVTKLLITKSQIDISNGDFKH